MVLVFLFVSLLLFVWVSDLVSLVGLSPLYFWVCLEFSILLANFVTCGLLVVLLLGDLVSYCVLVRYFVSVGGLLPVCFEDLVLGCLH